MSGWEMPFIKASLNYVLTSKSGNFKGGGIIMLLLLWTNTKKRLKQIISQFPNVPALKAHSFQQKISIFENGT